MELRCACPLMAVAVGGSGESRRSRRAGAAVVELLAQGVTVAPQAALADCPIIRLRPLSLVRLEALELLEV